MIHSQKGPSELTPGSYRQNLGLCKAYLPVMLRSTPKLRAILRSWNRVLWRIAFGISIMLDDGRWKGMESGQAAGKTIQKPQNKTMAWMEPIRILRSWIVRKKLCIHVLRCFNTF